LEGKTYESLRIHDVRKGASDGGKGLKVFCFGEGGGGWSRSVKGGRRRKGIFMLETKKGLEET